MKLPNFFQKKTERRDILNTSEIGGSGTKRFAGFIQEDYNVDLVGLQGVEKYEEMRSSDASTSAILLAAELPIRSTKWFVQAGQTKGEVTQKDIEIAEFVEQCLFNLQEGSFDQFLRQALTMLPFGYSVFEKVFMIKGDKIVLKKLAQRMQSSIFKWETEDGGEGITQNLFYDKQISNTTVSIPREYLAIFSFRKEGDNLAGRSMLRAAYKHWYMKDTLYKIDAIKHERLGVGIPVITLPKGHTKEDVTEAETIAQNLRGTEQTYVILPNDTWKIEFMDLKGGATSDPSKSIAHHDRQIAKSILAQFIDLGAESSGGSYALSEDQSSLFTLGLTAIANEFAEVVNQDIISQLVAYNFDIGEYQTIPYLTFSKIGDIDYEKLTNVISSIISSGIIQPDEKLEEYLREVLSLPERGEEVREVPAKNKEEIEKKKAVEEIKKEVVKEKKKNFSEEAAQFSEEVNIEIEIAEKILDFIKRYDTKLLEVQDVGIIINNLKHTLRMNVSMVSLLQKATDEEIEAVIEELIHWRTRMENQNVGDVSVGPSHGFADPEEAQYFKEAKEILSFLDVLNTQNGK